MIGSLRGGCAPELDPLQDIAVDASLRREMRLLRQKIADLEQQARMKGKAFYGIIKQFDMEDRLGEMVDKIHA